MQKVCKNTVGKTINIRGKGNHIPTFKGVGVSQYPHKHTKECKVSCNYNCVTSLYRNT